MPSASDPSSRAKPALQERERQFALGAQAPVAAISPRDRPLQDDERELLLREARMEADYEIRERKLEKREAAIVTREEKLLRREGDLGTYVAQVQDDFGRRESEWWSRQLGQPLEVTAS